MTPPPSSRLTGNYLSILLAMHRHARPRTYVEIGIGTGASLQLAPRSTRVIGIDPNPRLTRPLPSSWSVHAETSDAFFARPDVIETVGTVDVAFIDGLHLFEQALRDFMNLERRMAPNGVVLLHDCLPPDPSWATRTVLVKDAWAGDVWKLIPILREYRPDLRVVVSAARPTGLGIVSGLDGSNQQLHDSYGEIVSRYADLGYQPWPDTVGGRWAACADQFPVFQRRNLSNELESGRRRVGYLAQRLRRRWARLVS